MHDIPPARLRTVHTDRLPTAVQDLLLRLASVQVGRHLAGHSPSQNSLRRFVLLCCRLRPERAAVSARVGHLVVPQHHWL